MRILLICAFILSGKLQIETKSSDTDVISDSILHVQSKVVKNETMMLRIFGGEEVKPHAYPFLALLAITEPKGIHMCGGTLLTIRMVLTAANCIGAGIEIRPIVIFLGLHDFANMQDDEVQKYATVSYRLHQNFDQHTVMDNIAMVMLLEEAVLNDYVQLVTVATGTDDYVGQSATFMGWGKSEGDNAIAPSLKSVTAEVLTNEACREIYSSFHVTITERHMCVSRAGGKGGCIGDSGGPLVVKGVQIGLMSFGPSNCSSNEMPTVFTRLNQYEDWIRETEDSEADSLGIQDALFGLLFFILALE